MRVETTLTFEVVVRLKRSSADYRCELSEPLAVEIEELDPSDFVPIAAIHSPGPDGEWLLRRGPDGYLAAPVPAFSGSGLRRLIQDGWQGAPSRSAPGWQGATTQLLPADIPGGVHDPKILRVLASQADEASAEQLRRAASLVVCDGVPYLRWSGAVLGLTGRGLEIMSDAASEGAKQLFPLADIARAEAAASAAGKPVYHGVTILRPDIADADRLSVARMEAKRIADRMVKAGEDPRGGPVGALRDACLLRHDEEFASAAEACLVPLKDRMASAREFEVRRTAVRIEQLLSQVAAWRSSRDDLDVLGSLSP